MSNLVYARPLSSYFNGAINAFGNFFNYLFRFFTNGVVVYGFTVLLFFCLLYGIMAAALGRVNIFKGGKGGLNKRGKIVAVSMALLSLLAIFVGSDPRTVVIRILSPFGAFGGLLIAIVMFLVVYKGFENESGEKSWKFGLAAAGFGMVTAGMLMSYPNIMWWGWLIFLIGGIFWMIGMFGDKSGSSDSYGDETQFSFGNNSSSSPSSSSSTPANNNSSTTPSDTPTPSGGDEPAPDEPTPDGPTPEPDPRIPEPIHEWYPHVRGIEKPRGKMDGVVRRD